VRRHSVRCAFIEYNRKWAARPVTDAEVVMSKRTNAEVDRLLAELLPTPPLTDTVLAAMVIDVLGRVARRLTTAIEASESAEEAFERLAALGLGRQLYDMATAFNSVEKAKELGRAR
jgi:hypothetical protein